MLCEGTHITQLGWLCLTTAARMFAVSRRKAGFGVQDVAILQLLHPKAPKTTRGLRARV